MESYTIEHLTFCYPGQNKRALHDVSLTIGQGQFITLCGPSGCGKTTLLRQLKTVLAPHGVKTGTILFEGKPLESLDLREQSARIGFVQQNPDNQLVTDKVWHELAFGLESLGHDTPAIRLRVAEMASFFGIEGWFYKSVTELSGGQKQLLNLASIMAMQPSMLILDEPTSQLDPIAASEFLAMVGKINRELGITVLLTEHRLEEVLPLSDRMLVMDAGRVIADGEPREIGQRLGREKHKMFLAMPTPMRVFAGVPNALTCPITVREGRRWLDNFAKDHALQPVPPAPEYTQNGTPVVELKEVWFKYDKELPDVVKGLSLKAYQGEFLAVLGGNGTGKTTMLSLIVGLNRPYRGEVRIEGRLLSQLTDHEKFNGLLGVLPQNPQSLFVKKTVELDLYEMLKERGLSREEQARRVTRVASLCELTQLLGQHPYDLSGGEQQRAALAKVLLLEPRLLLLDEPTKGLDAEFKRTLAGILRRLLRRGVCIVMVSHDIEFCARYAHRCALFFDGSVVTEGAPRAFFSGNNFYTTSANRMARHRLPDGVTAEDVIAACGGTIPPEPEDTITDDPGKDFPLPGHGPVNTELEQKKPLRRAVTAGLSLLVLAVTLVRGFPFLKDFVLSGNDLAGTLSGNTADVLRYALLLILMAGAAAIFCSSVFVRSPRAPALSEQVAQDRRKLSKRTVAAAVMILLLIPLTIFVGVYYLGDRKYYFISLLVILETMLPFVMIFEGRKPQARELIVIAVLCALGVAGRAAFFMLPQFKPVMAMVIIAGVAFGGETGLLVGAITAFVSNFFFGQGPWTLWQMFAFGIIGFLAGVLFRKGLLLRGRLPLAVFGGLATFFIYGGIMNPASVIMFQARPTLPMFVLAYLQGIPFDLIHATATVFFLWVLSQPMLEKLDRIKVKYGLIE